MQSNSVFGSRCLCGEILFHTLERMQHPLVFGLSVGGMEVAYPIAYLGCGELRYLPLRLDPGDLAVIREPIVLADDGLTPHTDLVGGVRRLIGAGAREVTVAAPWLGRSIRRALADAPDVEVVTLHDHTPVTDLYDTSDRPSVTRVSWFLEAVRDHVHRDLVRALVDAVP